MHFSKTYAQVLEGLPPELKENAIQYRQLKKLINTVVRELSSFGLSPDLLHQLLEAQERDSFAGLEGSTCSACDSSLTVNLPLDEGTSQPGMCFPKAVYEFVEGSSKIEPQLRIPLETLRELASSLRAGTRVLEEAAEGNAAHARDEDSELPGAEPLNRLIPPGNTLLWSLQNPGSNTEGSLQLDTPLNSSSCEVIIPLVSDAQFFELLRTTLEHASNHLQSVQKGFLHTLTTLSRMIADSARPASSSRTGVRGSFHALSPLKDNVSSIHINGRLSKSDLYVWREIFQLYVEAEVFESVNESDRGERSLEESERRLQMFATQVTQRGLVAEGKFKLPQSRTALEAFLQLNLGILNIKKFQLANSEAIRKILKKHTKRTALSLPLDGFSSNTPPQLALIPQTRSFSLPHALVQAIGETLLPIIPHLDDYSCLICTNLAFKPIRLDCGHLFCVRCLVKMQKRGNGDCPLCRASSVLVADRSNVDWALMNFMQDWFPLEAKAKLKANEKEVLDEQLREMGIDPTDSHCIIM
ncbi:hypothetical protein Agabi119p4_10953 [Agaricus bisporus var. burnettii]|uniref:RING-type domain-containing protein n=1 Tax=Agaricus bisporus var. burnettii TaxID=192524 RepID=A0A8H7C0N6_AGABI|nr:hypothetical protein Agabi119p4_10953 [Agaricus bisporus var. burnettii]